MRSQRAAVTASMLYIVGLIVLSQGFLSPAAGFIRRVTGQAQTRGTNTTPQRGAVTPSKEFDR